MVGELGWLAPPPPGGGQGVHVRQTRQGREALSGDAPDLNPWDEGGWQHQKPVEPRDLVCLDLEELHEQFHRAVGRLRQKPQRVQSCFAQAGVKIEKT